VGDEGESVDFTICDLILELSQEVQVKVVCKDGIFIEGAYTVRG
jgi:hypothetical protein